MLDQLRKFIADIGSTSDDKASFADDDYRLATAALLVHIANVDGKIETSEKTRLRQIIMERFGLDATATQQLIAKAEESDREAVDFFHFTNVLKRSLDDDGRHKIIEMMWDVVFADGLVSEFEENVVWRIAELLGVSNRDRIMLRQKVADEPQNRGRSRGLSSTGHGRPAHLDQRRTDRMRAVALITGASTGIGADLARIFAEHGHDLALVARSGDKLNALASELVDASRPRPLVIPCDLSEPYASDLIANALTGAGARVEVLVNNAGYGMLGSV